MSLAVCIEINEMEKANLILNRLHFSEQFYVFSIPFQIRLAFNVCRLNCCVKVDISSSVISIHFFIEDTCKSEIMVYSMESLDFS